MLSELVTGENLVGALVVAQERCAPGKTFFTDSSTTELQQHVKPRATLRALSTDDRL